MLVKCVVTGKMYDPEVEFLRILNAPVLSRVYAFITLFG